MSRVQNTKFALLKSLIVGAVISVLLAGGTFYGGLVRADQFDDQIRQLQQQNSNNRNQSSQLGAQASGYQDQVDKLQATINGLEQAILDNQHKRDDLQRQIDEKQRELDHQKKVLGENIKAMYLEGKVSTLEILASSKNLSEFVDKEEYRNSVQDKIKTTLTEITKLKLELQQAQRVVEGLIHDEQSEEARVADSRNQVAALLSLTEDQKASVDQQIKNNNSQIASLRAQQAAANAALGGHAVPGDPGHGGYPARWDAPVPQDSLIDDWGMYNRECVSYTAWKVYETYGYMPYWGGVGNANQWPADARAAGIPVDNNPEAGSVAISMGGYYGHAMWVEGVNGDTIYVSQYNYDLQGHYSEMSVSNASRFYYLHFSQWQR